MVSDITHSAVTTGNATPPAPPKNNRLDSTSWCHLATDEERRAFIPSSQRSALPSPGLSQREAPDVRQSLRAASDWPSALLAAPSRATAGRYGGAVDGAAAAAPTPDVDQQHVCFLLQEVLLRGVDDGPRRVRHPAVHTEKRRQRCGKHEVSAVNVARVS